MSTEVDACLAYDTHGIIRKVLAFLCISTFLVKDTSKALVIYYIITDVHE